MVGLQGSQDADGGTQASDLLVTPALGSMLSVQKEAAPALQAEPSQAASQDDDEARPACCMLTCDMPGCQDAIAVGVSSCSVLKTARMIEAGQECRPYAAAQLCRMYPRPLLRLHGDTTIATHSLHFQSQLEKVLHLGCVR